MGFFLNKLDMMLDETQLSTHCKTEKLGLTKCIKVYKKARHRQIKDVTFEGGTSWVRFSLLGVYYLVAVGHDFCLL